MSDGDIEWVPQQFTGPQEDWIRLRSSWLFAVTEDRANCDACRRSLDAGTIVWVPLIDVGWSRWREIWCERCAHMVGGDVSRRHEADAPVQP